MENMCSSSKITGMKTYITSKDDDYNAATEILNSMFEKEESWHDATDVVDNGENDTEHFHQNPMDMENKKNLLALCGPFFMKKEAAQCTPLPNAFNPCEDIMGYEWLRVSVWLVLCTGLFGNLCVLATILSKHKELTVQSFLIGNLAFSDLCMAIYLLLLASQDIISKGYYFNYAFDWQEGIGCKIAGVITIFSNQLSIFILCLLTVERWFSIKRALFLNKLNFQVTVTITLIGWAYAILMAFLPLFGVSSYSVTSLCLPMTTENIGDTIYILLLLFFAGTAFVIICVCYYQIYFSLNYETRHKDGEYRLARKIGTLVAINFACWAPITFFALTAVAGFPLINISNSKILLVFFYPINSCANPFLYAILTTNFKRDFIHLLSRFGICRKYDRKYTLMYSSTPAGNNTNLQVMRSSIELK